MPDLSKMLGDVYGNDADESAAEPPARPAPEWSDDEHLDRAFADWTPGPADDAPAAERKLFAEGEGKLADDLAAALSEAVLAEHVDEPEVTVPDLRGAETPLAALVAVAEEAAAVEAPPEPAVETPEPTLTMPTPVARAVALSDLEPDTPTAVVEAAAPTVARSWQRDHDDILPSGRGPGRSLPRPNLPRPRLPRRPAKGPQAQGTPAPAAAEAKAPKGAQGPKAPKGMKAPKAPKEPKAKSSGGLWAKLNQPVGKKK